MYYLMLKVINVSELLSPLTSLNNNNIINSLIIRSLIL